MRDAVARERLAFDFVVSIINIRARSRGVYGSRHLPEVVVRVRFAGRPVVAGNGNELARKLGVSARNLQARSRGNFPRKRRGGKAVVRVVGVVDAGCVRISFRKQKPRRGVVSPSRLVAVGAGARIGLDRLGRGAEKFLRNEVVRVVVSERGGLNTRAELGARAGRRRSGAFCRARPSRRRAFRARGRRRSSSRSRGRPCS